MRSVRLLPQIAINKNVAQSGKVLSGKCQTLFLGCADWMATILAADEAADDSLLVLAQVTNGTVRILDEACSTIRLSWWRREWIRLQAQIPDNAKDCRIGFS